MSKSEKSLQEIYNEGFAHLNELQTKQVADIQKNSTDGLEELGKIESSTTSTMEASLQELDQDIVRYAENSAEAIKLVINSETDENKVFLDRLLQSMKLSSSSLSDDISQFRSSAIKKFELSADHYLSLLTEQRQKSLVELRIAATQSLSHLKDTAKSAVSSSKFNFSNEILEALHSNSKLPEDIVKGYLQKAESLDAHLNDCIQAVSERSKELIAETTKAGEQALISTDNSSKKVSDEIEKTRENVETSLKKDCEDRLASTIRKQDELSNKLCRTLQETVDSSGSGISKKSEDLYSEIQKSIELVTQFLEGIECGIRKSCEDSTTKFDETLAEKVASSNEHKKLVTDELERLMQNITVDLQKIEADFETRIAELANKCQKQLSQACTEAELSIVAAHDTCASEFKSTSSEHRKIIDERTEKLIVRIENTISEAVKNMQESSTGESNKAAAPVQMPAEGDDNNLFGDFGDLKL